jgi:hypothetical protein
VRDGLDRTDRLEHLKRPEFVRPKFDTLTPAQKVAILAPCNPRTFLGARNLEARPETSSPKALKGSYDHDLKR